MMKVAIIGYSGSGKSTLAREIGVVNDIPCTSSRYRPIFTELAS